MFIQKATAISTAISTPRTYPAINTGNWPMRSATTSIESMKLANSGDLGALIGRPRAPEKETLRDHLAALASLELSSQLTDALARRLLEQQRIDKEVFFIDGHFLPYYGLHLLTKGY